MDCKEIEELISDYIEHDLEPEVYEEVSLHLEKCLACSVLKRQVEELVSSFPDLEEEIPFFLKNRLYYIPETQEENIIDMESKRYYLRWVAAVIGIFVLFLNLFYFTNIYPPANRALHTVVAEIETFAVKTEAIYEKVKESKALFFLSSEDEESNGNEDTKSTTNNKDENSMDEKK
jgi:predicted anti-sigma-YlaC factor YlaD